MSRPSIHLPLQTSFLSAWKACDGHLLLFIF